MTSTNAQRAGANLFASSDVFSTNHLLRTNHNTLSIYLSRLYFSTYCRGFYLFLILLSLFCVIWTLLQFGQFPDEAWFLAIEAFVSGMIIGEVTGRVVMQGCSKFYRSWLNVFDFIVAGISMGVLIDVVHSVSIREDVEGLACEIWLVLRCILQYLRLIVFIKNQEKAQVMVLQVINFSELAQPSRVTREEPIPLGEVSKMHLTEEFDEKDGFVKVKRAPSALEETKAVS